MAVSDTLTSIQENLAAAYDSLSSKGADIPEDRNIANLAAAVESVQGGGGGGLPINGDYGSFVYNGNTVQVTSLSDYLALAYKAGEYDYNTPAYSLSSGSYTCSQVTSYTWGKDCVMTPQYFLAESGVTTLNGDCPTTDFGAYFLAKRSYSSTAAFRGPLSIPKAVNIGEGFLYQQNLFSGELVIPATVEYVGGSFMYHCTGFNGPLVIESPNPPVNSGYSLDGWTTGVEVSGEYAQVWLDTLKNTSTRLLYIDPHWPEADYLTLTSTDGTVTNVTNGAQAYKILVLGNLSNTNGLNNTQSIVVGTGVSDRTDLTKLTKFPYAIPLTSISGMENFTHVTEMVNCFSNLSEFNQPITLPPNLAHMSYCLQYMDKFNSTVTFPSSLRSIIYFLYQCVAFNQPVAFNDELETFGGIYNCSVFDQPVTFPDSIKWIGDYTLAGNANFNQPVTFPAEVLSIGDYCLWKNAKFNQPVNIPAVKGKLGNSFLSENPEFNSPVTQVAAGDLSGGNILSNNPKFNSAVTLAGAGENGKIGGVFLAVCPMFNQPISIPDGVTEIGTQVFQANTVFNSQVQLPNSLKTIGAYFMGSNTAFNQELLLPNGITEIGAGFMESCTAFEQSLSIPETVTKIGAYNFMYRTNRFIGPLTVNTEAYPGKYDGSVDNSSLATNNAAARMYTVGVTLQGSGASAWKNGMPDIDFNPYRKLVLATS